MTDDASIRRRKLLLYALGGATGAATAVVGGVEGWERYQRKKAKLGPAVVDDRPGLVDPKAIVTERRRLGRTNLPVSVIGIGAGALDELEPIARAVDKGMNYIDTSCCYKGSEDTLGRAFRAYPGLREKVYVATKWDPGASSTKAEMLASLDKSLQRMGIAHVDIMQIHWLGGGHKSPDTGHNRLDNPELYLAMEEAKKAGKVRFFGATSHDGRRGPILMHAIDKGFDMILVKMNVMDYEAAQLPALLSKAKEKDVGVVVMKSQPDNGKIPPGYEQSTWSIFQANLRWVLEHDAVACVVHSKMGFDPKAQDQAASAVQGKLGELDRTLLDQYVSALSGDYCRECASGCVDACPEGIAIPHVAHLTMYDRRYAWHDYAKELYEALPSTSRFSERCLSCRLCNEACPYGVDAAERVRWAQTSLAPSNEGST